MAEKQQSSSTYWVELKGVPTWLAASLIKEAHKLRPMPRAAASHGQRKHAGWPLFPAKPWKLSDFARNGYATDKAQFLLPAQTETRAHKEIRQASGARASSQFCVKALPQGDFTPAATPTFKSKHLPQKDRRHLSAACCIRYSSIYWMTKLKLAVAVTVKLRELKAYT